MKNLIIKFLFRLLTPVTHENINEVLVKEWLRMTYKEPGFHEYFRMRDFQLMKSAALELDKNKHCVLIGQRLELISLLQNAKLEYSKKGKENLIQKARKAEAVGAE